MGLSASIEAASKFVSSHSGLKDSSALFLVATSTIIVAATVFYRLVLADKGGEFLDRERKFLTIGDIEQVSHDTKRFRLRFPSNKMVLGLPCGKHFRIYMKNPNKGRETWNRRPDTEKNLEEIERQYTPLTGNEVNGYVDLVVKCYRKGDVKMPDGQVVSWTDGGKVSGYLDELKVGDKLCVNGPYGRVNYRGNGLFKTPTCLKQYKNVGMMAGGSGLTPMFQIAKYAIDNDTVSDIKFSLIYANKTEDDILCRDLLDELAARSNGRFKVEYTVDFPPQNWKYSTGFINVDMIKRYLPAPVSDTLILMCGPPPMVKFACQENLQKLGYETKDTAAF